MGKVTPFTDEERERIRELHGQGHTREAIAAELGRSETGVAKVAARMGLRFTRRHAKPEPVEPVPLAEEDRPRASEPAQPPRSVDESAVDRGPESIDPAVWTVRGMREALARRDIPTVYELLKLAGVSQRQIAALVGQSQSEVSEIRNGRQVVSYDVLVRICEGLGTPRGWMGLAHDETTVGLGLAPTGGATYVRDQEGNAESEADEDMKRRQALANATAIVFGKAVLGSAVPLGTFAAAEYEPPLPDWLTRVDVAAVRGLTERFQAASREYGGCGGIISPIAIRRDRLLVVPGDEDTVRALHRALAELHSLAGWCAFDELRLDLARWHFSRAIKLATVINDPWSQIWALRHAAFMCREQGAADDALKLYQMAQTRLLLVPDRPELAPRVAEEQGSLAFWSARAFAQLGLGEQTDRELERAREFAEPDDRYALADRLHAQAAIALDFGRLDEAERYAEASADTFGPGSRREAAGARVTLAITHLRANDSGWLRLAEDAIAAVQDLASMRRRAKLAPLESALTRRGDSTGVELARWARAVRTGS